MSTPRTLIIGLDGATFTLLDPLVRAGWLPTLGRLIEQGVQAPLWTWPNMNSEAGWTSLVTGCNSGKHNIYSLWEWSRRDYDLRPVTAADRRKDPIWQYLSAAGKRVGIINVPLSFPVDPVNGFMVAGMHEPNIDSDGVAYPPGLLAELQRQGIDYVIHLPDLPELCYRHPRRALREAERMVDLRSRTILHLMRTEPWDLFMAVFVATDILQHFYWPDNGTDVDHESWTPIRRIYQQIDSFLNDALSVAGEEATVFVVSDHGFGPSRFLPHGVDRFFAAMGLLRYSEKEQRLLSRLRRNLVPLGRRVIPLWLQNLLVKTIPRHHRQALGKTESFDIDWSRTQVFTEQAGRGVRVNLMGREGEGMVPEERYDSFCEEIRSALLNLLDAPHGRQLIRAVHRRDEVFTGPYAGDAPDLLIEWAEEANGTTLYYETADEPIIIRTPPKTGMEERITGHHRPQGVFIAYGPDIKRGVTGGRTTIYDIAPTILYLQDHPIPPDLDGRVLTEIFTDEYVRIKPVLEQSVGRDSSPEKDDR